MSPFLINLISIVLGLLAILAPLVSIYKNKFVFLLATASALLCSLVLFAQLYYIKALTDLGDIVKVADRADFIVGVTGLFIVVVIILNAVSILFNRIKKQK